MLSVQNRNRISVSYSKHRTTNMRDPKRISQVLNELRKYWVKYPDLRLGQIVSNAHDTHRALNDLPLNRDVFHFEDDELLPILEEQNK